MFTSIEGRSVVVTGGSRGIGRGIARVFAAAGARVMIVARDEAAAAGAVANIGGETSYLLADLADPASAELLAEAALARHGGVDVLCCNAGIYPASPLREMTRPATSRARPP